jgi:hypothetical protein
MMDSILKALHELAGVSATLVFDASGKVAARGGRAAQDTALIDQLAGTLVKAVDSIQLQHADWDAISAQYADGKVLLRNLGPVASTSYYLALISDSTLNVSFAAVAMRVAVNKLKKALGTGASPPPAAAAQAAAAPPTLLRGVAPAVSAAAGAPPSVEANPALANSGLSWSRVSSSGIGTSSIAVADSAASNFLMRCSKELARYVGPMAKVFIKESVRRVSPDAPFTLAMAPRLVADLATHISDPSGKLAFSRALAKT